MRKTIFTAASLVILSFVSAKDGFVCGSDRDCIYANLGSQCIGGACAPDNLTDDFNSKIIHNIPKGNHASLEQSFKKCKTDKDCDRGKVCKALMCQQKTVE